MTTEGKGEGGVLSVRRIEGRFVEDLCEEEQRRRRRSDVKYCPTDEMSLKQIRCVMIDRRKKKTFLK